MQSRKKSILIVDDLPENLQVLISILSQQYAVIPCKSALRALQIAEHYPQPDLILLDIMMPEMDGLEVCRRLKKNRQTSDIPVIFVTARDSTQDEAQGLALGAVDYVTKPFNAPIILARIANHLALRIAYQDLEQTKDQLLHERKLIETILRRMRAKFDKTAPWLRTLMTPLEKTNGDLVLAHTTPDGCHQIMVGDFTGHGLAAALGGPLVDEIFHTRMLAGHTLRDIIVALNRTLYQRLPINLFLAAIFIEIDPNQQVAQLWNASMPDIFLSRNHRMIQRFPSSSLALGIIEELKNVTMVEITLEKEDRLYAFSDGILEAKNPQNELFNYARFEQTMIEISQNNQPFSVLHERLVAFQESSDFLDDLTLIEYKL
ncbi:SpoIIE family protein phosphatase [Magnetococcales bacterium HHB-1]